MRLISEGQLENSLRYNHITGATDRLTWQKSTALPVWDGIPETGAVPKGDFDVHLVETAHGAFIAVRIDRISGITWLDVDGAWTQVRDPTTRARL
jgi:hypothetical protein